MNEDRFHIDIHGKPAPCKAKQNCPRGGDSEHFPTVEEAQQYADRKNEFKEKIQYIETVDFEKTMNDLPQLKDFLSKITDFGGEGYFVGGFIRDKLLGKESKDIDIEFHNVSLENFRKIAKENGVKLDLVGESFGVLKAKLDGQEIDLSFPRTEELTGNSHKDFDVTVDPFIGEEKATERRDFTINSIMQSTKTGKIIDYHNGLEDLNNGIIKHVGPKYSEDPLRVYRAAQFASRFGFKIHEDTIEISKNIDLTTLSRERVLEEFKKGISKSKKPSEFFNNLKEMGHLKENFSYLDNQFQLDYERSMTRIDNLSQNKDKLPHYEAIVISSIYDDDNYKNLDNSNETKRFLEKHNYERENKIAQAVANYELTRTNADVMDAMFAIDESSEELIEMVRYKDIDFGDLDEQKGKYQFLRDNYKNSKENFLTGKDLIALGYKPGKEIGEKLREVKVMAFLGYKKDAIINELKLTN